MDKHQISQEQLVREESLYLYLCALARADFETMDVILQKAEHDPVLDVMIVEAHQGDQEEDPIIGEIVQKEIRLFVQQYLSLQAMWEDEANTDLPLVTIGDVFTKLQQERTLPSPVKVELSQVVPYLSQREQPLPETLSAQAISRLFEQLGVSVSTRLQKVFREHALLLSMGRQQGIAHLSAARRQKRKNAEQQKEQGKQEQS